MKTRNRNGTAEQTARRVPGSTLPVNGTTKHLDNRLPAPSPVPPAVNGNGVYRDREATLAVFCFEDPQSPIGQYVARTAAALARRQTPVHLFARHAFALDEPGVHLHTVGESEEDDLIDRMLEFTRRACNAFLQQFPACAEHVTLMGHEWSSFKTVSILRGIKYVQVLLTLHSLERQRSDMTSDLSKAIEEIELLGLHEARRVLLPHPVLAETIKYWAPDCADRLVSAHQRFPTHHFERDIDPGNIKARYQVGPIDPTILYVGDLSERYGPDILVKALPAILRNHAQARLVVVGDGTLYWPLRVYARYLLLEHAVRLVGHLEGQALNDLVQAADVIVVPSREPTPWWPILAGWAAKRPVVATHQTAPTLLEHDQDSVLFYPSENSCVWGVERVLFDAELGRHLGARGNLKLEERYGWNGVAAQIEELMGVPQARVDGLK